MIARSVLVLPLSYNCQTADSHLISRATIAPHVMQYLVEKEATETGDTSKTSTVYDNLGNPIKETFTTTNLVYATIIESRYEYYK